MYPQQSYGLPSGSDGFEKVAQESYNSSRIPLTHPGVANPIFPSVKKPISGVILPAFDRSLQPHDTAFAASYVPYRQKDDLDAETGFPKFTSWFTVAKIYGFFGTGKSTFLSPVSAMQPDPIVDLRKYIYGQKDRGNSAYEYLVKATPNWQTDIKPLGNAGRCILMNTFGAIGDDPATNRILVSKTLTTARLFATLNELAPAALTPHDAMWPAFTYGDITNPTAALRYTSAEALTDTSNAYAALMFGSSKMTPSGAMALNCTPAAITEEQLRGRYDLTDTANVMYIPTYDEIVNLLVEERLVPYDLIAAVCGDKTNNMPPAPTGKVHYNAPAAMMSAPAPAPAAAPMPAPAAPAAAVALDYWVTTNGGVKEMSEGGVIELAASNPALPVMKKGETAWKTAASYGLVATPTPPAVAPMPAPAPAASPMPAAPAAAPMPAAPTVTAGKSARSAEEEAEFQDLMKRCDTGTPAMSQPDIERFAALYKMQAPQA